MLRIELQEVVRPFMLRPLLAVPVDRAVNLSYEVEDGLRALLVKGSRDAVHPGELLLGSQLHLQTV